MGNVTEWGISCSISLRSRNFPPSLPSYSGLAKAWLMNFEPYYDMRMLMCVMGLKPLNTFMEAIIPDVGTRNNFIIPKFISIADFSDELSTFWVKAIYVLYTYILYTYLARYFAHWNSFFTFIWQLCFKSNNKLYETISQLSFW